MVWTVPQIWEDGECWLIGGGPSIPQQFGVPAEVVDKVLSKELSPSAYSEYMAPIHSKHVIGVNAAYLLGDWIDFIFFGDNRFFLEHKEALRKHPAVKVTCHAIPQKYPWVKYLPRDREKQSGISNYPNTVAWNANSGAAAISLAVHLGVKRIILLGFDMKLGVNNEQHWHSLYKGTKLSDRRRGNLPFPRHLVGFEQIAKDAKRMGVEIVNASPESAITQFPKLVVKELL